MKVLDASGVINARDKFEGDYITVEDIIREVKDIQARMKLEAAIADKKVLLEEPSENSLAKVRGVAEENGALPLLSLPDTKVIALAYEKNLPIVTDDYDIQNMCWIMGLGFETVAKPGIKGPYSWRKKCTACGKEYAEDVSECEACGSNHFKVLKK
jgi:UPF0271 protein